MPYKIYFKSGILYFMLQASFQIESKHIFLNHFPPEPEHRTKIK